MKTFNIRTRKNIVNFDEVGVRTGCLGPQEIIVPDEVREWYAVSPENRRSLTIMETINAAGDYPPPPLVIIIGHAIMVSWFSEDLLAGTRIVTSKSGFTNDEITLAWLKHYIENSNAGPEADWKLLLMDNHGSHLISEFLILANDNHIRPFPFIPHLTHCMQPLDVGIFQPYKRWHQVAIQEAIAENFVKYSTSRFLKDLTKIRNNTFKNSTIRHAFENSGMWPVNASKCIEKLKTYAPDPPKDKSPSPSLPSLPRHSHPQQITDVEFGLKKWGTKILRRMNWSDPAHEDDFHNFLADSHKVITNSVLDQGELKMWQNKRISELHEKKINRKRLKPKSVGLGLSKEDALAELAARARREEEAEKKKVENNFMKMWR